MLVNYSSDSDLEDVIPTKRPSILVNPAPYANTTKLELQHHQKVMEIMRDLEKQN